MTPYFEDHDVTLHQGDVRDVLAALPAESVNCVVTSPPYYGLRDYGVDGQIGLEASPAEYVEQMRAVFAQVNRVLASDGVLWLNLGDSYSAGGQGGNRGGNLQSPHLDKVPKPTKVPGFEPKNLLGVPWRVAFALQDDGWTLRNAVIWHKPNAMPESVTDRLSTRYEHVFLFSKSRRYWFDLDSIREDRARGERFDAVQTGDRKGHEQAGRNDRLRSGSNPASVWNNTGVYQSDGKNPGDVWAITTNPFPGAHFATFPPELVRRCILSGCPEDGTVLDPFAGSGTTLMVARQLGRKSVGIELNPDYCDIAIKRIGDPVFDFSAAGVTQ